MIVLPWWRGCILHSDEGMGVGEGAGVVGGGAWFCVVEVSERVQGEVGRVMMYDFYPHNNRGFKVYFYF